MAGKIFTHTRKLDAVVWPGGYPLLYLIKDGIYETVMCPDCATERKETGDLNLQPIECTAFVHWEGPAEHCEECSKAVESAYGDPDADTDSGES